MTENVIGRDATDRFVGEYGATRIALLRQIYGMSFATGIDGRRTLSEVVGSIDRASLDRVVHDHAVAIGTPGAYKNAG